MAVTFLFQESAPANDGQTHYNGATLPRDKKDFVPVPVDPTNNPSSLKIGSITIPQDVVCYITGEKVVAETKILDGPPVLEHITRAAYELEFEFTIREKDDNGNYIFGQNSLYDLWQNIWLPDGVQKIQNTFLNKLGVQEMVIRRIQPMPFRGSRNIGMRITGTENINGVNLIVK